jgi:hypothetical protein
MHSVGRILASLFVAVVATTNPAFANCAPGTERDDSDVSLIRWSTVCSVGGGPTMLSVLQRIVRYDGTIAYLNGFRGGHGVSLIGTYYNEDEALFKSARDLVSASAVESMRLRVGYYLDGCASYVAVTRCNATIIISELQMDYDDPQFKRLEQLLRDLTKAALQSHWTKESDEKMVWPLMLDEINQPGQFVRPQPSATKSPGT